MRHLLSRLAIQFSTRERSAVKGPFSVIACTCVWCLHKLWTPDNRAWNRQYTDFNCYLVGPGLGFVAYPEGIAQMPGASVWAVLFFFMLFNIGLGSQVRTQLRFLLSTPPLSKSLPASFFLFFFLDAYRVAHCCILSFFLYLVCFYWNNHDRINGKFQQMQITQRPHAAGFVCRVIPYWTVMCY